MSKLTIPDFALVVLVGASGSGKSTFAKNHFLPTEVISSDFCRGLVSDDENDQAATKDAFEVLHFIASKRLTNMKLTVIDATNVQPEARQPLIKLAKAYHALPVAVVLDMPEGVCIERNKQRPDRDFPERVIRGHRRLLHKSLRHLEKEGFRRVLVLKTVEDVQNAVITREPLWNNRKTDTGPFDIIGDIHGCFDELVLLLNDLGYKIDGVDVTPPPGRRAIFLGDLVDRGPKIPQVLKLVMSMVANDVALCIPGNHDVKLMRALRGKNVQLKHGLAQSMEQLEAETPEFKQQAAEFIDSLVSHYLLDEGKLVVAHAGMKENMAGRASGAVREFALYGDTTGETDEFGLPVRYPWARDYRGQAMVVYGHTPVPEAEWLNRTINIDTGCVFGGALTALRYPEQELVSVPALQQYAEPARPFLPDITPDAVGAHGNAPSLTAQQTQDDILDIADVTGRRYVNTRLQPNITIREENSAAALEVMSRFAVNPKWLIYLPPTMSPCETSPLPDFLEHPAEAFGYYRNVGVEQVICEEKHMGSRAIVVICRDEDIARSRFGVTGEGIGVCYTRTGRRFFNDAALETAFLQRVHAAVTASGLWEELDTGWLLLDCELMPWSFKAQELLQTQYAAAGAAAKNALHETMTVLQAGAAQGRDVSALLERYENRAEIVNQYIDTYRRYCRDVLALEDLKLAPFHLLASEGAAHVDKNHDWHMRLIQKLCQADAQILRQTGVVRVNVRDETSASAGIDWWLALIERGGEGMVVKPQDFVVKGKRGIVQPAVKVRGREYLRLIYGAEYTSPANIAMLRSRGLSTKRSLASREFSLGIEALERFIRHEPLRRVHECVFGVLALESEPVDPRL